MHRLLRPATGLLLPAAAVLGSFALAGSASADQAQTFSAALSQVNGSGAAGTANLSLTGDQLTVTIDSTGLTPGEPHAQHLHGMIGGHNVCPTPADDTNGDGFITTTEATPSYGMINVSLTTTGDTGASTSALAVDRFPVADANGNLHYSRTITVSSEVAANLGSLHIVQHGVDFNKDGTYDGDRKSDLDPSLPAEATDPSDCGMLSAVSTTTPVGGVQTGGGGTATVFTATSHTSHASHVLGGGHGSGGGDIAIAVVGVAVVAAASGVAVSRSRRQSDAAN
jgi:hypothetical protein